MIDKDKMNKYPQSQGHGFEWETEVRIKVFNLSASFNDTHIHDIPKNENALNKNENISIKCSGSNTIYCGDILRFYDYNFTDENTIICIRFQQTKTHKTINNICEINYNKKCHELLFGNLPRAELEKYVKGVKSIPTKVKGSEAKTLFPYLIEKKNLKNIYDFGIKINPKVDSSQSRVQCSVSNFLDTLKDFITYRSTSEQPNLLRGKEIIASLKSPPRSRGGVTKKNLISLCRENGIKMYSKLKKSDLKELLVKSIGKQELMKQIKLITTH